MFNYLNTDWGNDAKGNPIGQQAVMLNGRTGLGKTFTGALLLGLYLFRQPKKGQQAATLARNGVIIAPSSVHEQWYKTLKKMYPGNVDIYVQYEGMEKSEVVSFMQKTTRRKSMATKTAEANGVFEENYPDNYRRKVFIMTEVYFQNLFNEDEVDEDFLDVLAYLSGSCILADEFHGRMGEATSIYPVLASLEDAWKIGISATPIDRNAHSNFLAKCFMFNSACGKYSSLVKTLKQTIPAKMRREEQKRIMDKAFFNFVVKFQQKMVYTQLSEEDGGVAMVEPEHIICHVPFWGTANTGSEESTITPVKRVRRRKAKKNSKKNAKKNDVETERGENITEADAETTTPETDQIQEAEVNMVIERSEARNYIVSVMVLQKMLGLIEDARQEGDHQKELRMRQAYMKQLAKVRANAGFAYADEYYDTQYCNEVKKDTRVLCSDMPADSKMHKVYDIVEEELERVPIITIVTASPPAAQLMKRDLRLMGYTTEMIDGKVAVEDRYKYVQNFNETGLMSIDEVKEMEDSLTDEEIIEGKTGKLCRVLILTLGIMTGLDLNTCACLILHGCPPSRAVAQQVYGRFLRQGNMMLEKYGARCYTILRPNTMDMDFYSLGFDKGFELMETVMQGKLVTEAMLAKLRDSAVESQSYYFNTNMNAYNALKHLWDSIFKKYAPADLVAPKLEDFPNDSEYAKAMVDFEADVSYYYDKVSVDYHQYLSNTSLEAYLNKYFNPTEGVVTRSRSKQQAAGSSNEVAEPKAKTTKRNKKSEGAEPKAKTTNRNKKSDAEEGAEPKAKTTKRNKKSEGAEEPKAKRTPTKRNNKSEVVSTPTAAAVEEPVEEPAKPARRGGKRKSRSEDPTTVVEGEPESKKRLLTSKKSKKAAEEPMVMIDLTPEEIRDIEEVVEDAAPMVVDSDVQDFIDLYSCPTVTEPVTEVNVIREDPPVTSFIAQTLGVEDADVGADRVNVEDIFDEMQERRVFLLEKSVYNTRTEEAVVVEEAAATEEEGEEDEDEVDDEVENKVNELLDEVDDELLEELNEALDSTESANAEE